MKFLAFYNVEGLEVKPPRGTEIINAPSEKLD